MKAIKQYFLGVLFIFMPVTGVVTSECEEIRLNERLFQ